MAAPAPATPATSIYALIRAIVAPHSVANIAPQQASLIASVDAALTDQIWALLHAPAFQQPESARRGAQWLISNLALDEQLQLHLFDVSRNELLGDVVAAQGCIDQTGVYRALVDRWRNQPGGQGWSGITALYGVGPSVEHIDLLAALGLLASQAGGPLLAAGDPALAGRRHARPGLLAQAAAQRVGALDRPGRALAAAAPALWPGPGPGPGPRPGGGLCLRGSGPGAGPRALALGLWRPGNAPC